MRHTRNSGAIKHNVSHAHTILACLHTIPSFPDVLTHLVAEEMSKAWSINREKGKERDEARIYACTIHLQPTCMYVVQCTCTYT